MLTTINKFKAKWVLVLLWALLPMIAQACFIMTQPAKPTISKQGSSYVATYKIVGIFGRSSVGDTCAIEEISSKNKSIFSNVGYTFIGENWSVKNAKSDNVVCGVEVKTTGQSSQLVIKQQIDSLFVCTINFDINIPFTGTYSGTNPISDIFYTPTLVFTFTSPFSSSSESFPFTSGIPIPSEPARTCSLTHPGTVTMAKTKPSDFFAALLLQPVGNFSVTLNCPSTTSARSGTPNLLLSYPSVKATNGLCFATNQANPAVASPVLVQIKRADNSIVCGDSAVGQGSVQNFATFTNAAAYSSTLSFVLNITSLNANPAPGVFTTSVTLQVQYP